MTAGAHPSVTDAAEGARDARAVAGLAMWVFIASEVLFFGVLFFAYLIARLRFPDAFSAASRRTNLTLGTLNTAILLTSSVSMALGVQAIRVRRREAAAGLLAVTAGLGIAFLAVKGVEYRDDYRQALFPGGAFAFAAPLRSGAELFFWLYLTMTGVHAVHLAIGVALVGGAAIRTARSKVAIRFLLFVECAGLYWHFVDLVWIFLYPCLYLVSRS